MDKSKMLTDIKKHLNIDSAKGFAEYLGIKPTALSMWYKRNTFDIETVFTKCDFINPRWLLTGQGDMIVNSYSQTKENIAEESSEPIYSNAIDKGIPLIPTYAMAGLSSGTVSISEGDIMQYYNVPDFVDVDFMIRVKGSSMYPKYNSGDVVACRMINSSSFLQWNKVHVIATKEQGVLIKRLKESEDKEYLKAISDNMSYDAFEIPKEEILNIALVVGVIRLE